MWRNGARLLLGFAVLVGSVGFLLSTFIGWKYFWQKQVSTAVQPHPVPLIDPTLAKDPSIAGAKLEVIGPLANAMNGQNEILTTADDAPARGVPPQNQTGQEPAVTAAPELAASAFDLAAHAGPQAAQHFHATFRVSSYRYFRLLVPAHTRSPRLQGTFHCSGRSKNDGTADFLVLDDDQLKDFVQGTGSAASSNEASGGIIDISLNPTVLNPKQYYLVFSNPDRRGRTITADLTATFD